MITLIELLSGHSISEVEISIQHNLEELLKRINAIRVAYNKPMMVTSGLRFMSDHLRIYSKINADRRSKGLPEISVPMGSKHLTGMAVDITDPNQDLQLWCKNNEPLLASIGLWMEDFSATPTWCHFQTLPPASGKRWFKP